jgi:cytochrome c biogenesis protein CcmG/thiol:disulfide interchange protein DsbE
VALGVGVVVLSLGLVFVASIRKPQVQAHANLLGKDVPAVTLPSLTNASKISTKPAAGHVVVINFWNSWCIPCRQEQNALKQFYAAHKDDPGFTMIGVLRDDSSKAAAAYARAEGLKWNLVSDPRGDAAIAFGTTGQPETYVVGADGVVAGSLIGPATVDDLDRMLTAAQGTT